MIRMGKTGIFLFILAIIVNPAIELSCQDDLRVLGPDYALVPENEMMRNYLNNLTTIDFQKRAERLERLDTPEHIESYQKEMRAYFLDVMNLPVRTPLKPSIVGRVDYDDYRLEKVIYESQPGFFVTALMYLPYAPPPYPAVLVLAGHNNEGKAAYQEICINLAQQGFAVLSPDPIGQGERKQILSESGKGIYPPTTEHMIEGVVPLLLSQSLTTHMVWDGIRALDYLTSRPDIDSTKIGCLGNSGGGNRTSYLMAIDERVSCAAVSSFITTNARKNNFPGPGDAEQNIYRQIKVGMDHADYIIMRAPKPTLILSPTNDFVPVEGAWEAFREAHRIYTKLGYPEHVGIIEVDGNHGLSQTSMIGAVRWMKRWLMDIDEPVLKSETHLKEHTDLQCSPEGQVLQMDGARSLFELYAEKETSLVGARNRFFREHNNSEIRDQIRILAGIRNLADISDPHFEERGVVSRKEYHIIKGVLSWEEDILLPVLNFVPKEKNGECYIYLHDQGKSFHGREGGAIEKLVHEGYEVMAVDIRGIGETATTPWRYVQAHEFTGHDAAEFYIALMLGKSFVGMRAEDILAVAKHKIQQDPSQRSHLHLISWGTTCPAALHAMVLEPGLFQSLTMHDSLASWQKAVRSGITKNVLINVVPGALEYYDLPDLIKMDSTDSFGRKIVSK
jgi:dienelactone hydrolase